jgi:hypothetical protein
MIRRGLGGPASHGRHRTPGHRHRQRYRVTPIPPPLVLSISLAPLLLYRCVIPPVCSVVLAGLSAMHAWLVPEMGARGLVCGRTFSLYSLEALVRLGQLHVEVWIVG